MTCRRVVGWWSVAVALVFVAPTSFPPGISAQEVAGSETITVFQDCQTFGCDSELFREEVNFVNWVRDREVADVHVLVTAQGTGGGGRLFTLEFIGRGDFEGRELELTWAASGDATGDEVRRGLARTIKYGLMPYVSASGVAEELEVVYEPAAAAGEVGAAPGSGVEVHDPWNFWVFTLGMNAFLNGQSQTSRNDFSGSVSARRTTEAWKVSLSARGSRAESSFELEQGTFETVVKNWSSSGLLARSLTDHWTLGARANAGSSTYDNERLKLRFAPGVEYNIFPYSESTKRELTLLYSVGVNYFDYYEETIFLETEETRVDHALTARLDLNRPWGQVSLFADGSQYLHDAKRWRTTLGGSFSVRLFKGFRFNAGGNYSWIRDQLSLELGDATDEQVLTRQRALATNFSYFTHFGISYTFGSIFNNVVNPRYGGGGGFGMVSF